MKKSIVVAAVAMLTVVGFATSPVNASGCVKGAVVGGVAGHVVAHHGLLGATAGCMIGRHESNKRTRSENWDRDHRSEGDGSSREPNDRYHTDSENSR
jgi:hypothetical protein